MPSADIAGVSLFYDEKGNGNPLVLVHGIPTDYRAWKAQMEPFARKRRVLAVSRSMRHLTTGRETSATRPSATTPLT